MRSLAIKRRIFENGTGRKGNDMKACPSWSRNDGLRVPIHLLLLSQVGNGRIGPDETMDVPRHSREIVVLQQFITLDDRLTLHFCCYNASVARLSVFAFRYALHSVFFANTTGPHIVRTTRNSAFPLIMRAYPSAAFPSGYFSIMGRTPVISANLRVS